jgi:hypothetical protein
VAIALNRSRQVPADETPAFGGIAERFRRAGDLERAVALCRDGLKKFPDHLSARVTLGWSLLDLGRYDEAQVELEQALKRAPDNLAAIRGLAELHERAENAVVVPMDDHEAVEATAALEAARVPEPEKAPSAPPEPAKRAKAQPPPTTAQEPPAAKQKVEHHEEPETPHAAPPVKHQSSGPSVFSQPMLAQEAEKNARAEKAEANAAVAPAAKIDAKSEPHFEPKPAPKVDAKPEPPSLEALAAEFEAPEEPFTAAPPPSAVIEPVRVLDSRGEEVPDLTRAAATADLPVALPAGASVPNLVDELVTPAAAAMGQPPEVIDDFIPPPASAMTIPDAVVDDAPVMDLPMVDFAADAEALLSSDALLSAVESEPAASAATETVELDRSHAALLAAEEFATAADAHPRPELTESHTSSTGEAGVDVHAAMFGADHPALAPAAHPEPDVNELLAQLAHEDESRAPSSAMFAAEPDAPVDAHPQPDVADLPAQFAQDQSAEASHASIFAADAFGPAPEWHPEPQIADVLAPAAAIEAAPVEPELAWTSAATDFVAALEATHITPAAVPESEPQGLAFALSAELPAAVEADDFAFMSEPVAAIEQAADQPSMIDQFRAAPDAPTVALGTAQVLNFEAPPAPAPAFVVVAPPPAPFTALVPEVAAPPPASPIVAPTPAIQVEAQTKTIPPNVFAPMVAEPPAELLKPAPKAASPLLKKKNRNVAALEKMLRRIASRRLELASEYQPS